MKINRLPKDDRTNGWSGVLAPRQANPSVAGDVVADWLVLGAGYAGLAAARRLAELHPDQSIVLVDAGEAGENASGRNSGFAIDLPHNVGSSLEELKHVRNQLSALLREGGAPPTGKFSDLKYLEPIKDYKARHGSTMLSFDAVVKAIEQYENNEIVN